MKKTSEIKPDYGAVYCAAIYPQLCSIFHTHGYALAVHGSLARDFDLVAIPWVENVSEPELVIKDIKDKGFAINIIGDIEAKPHGRISYVLSVGFGTCACDLSFMPKMAAAKD